MVDRFVHSPITFYTHSLCPYAQRVAILLKEKRIDYSTCHIDLADKPSWYYSVNPNGLVPAIAHNGDIIIESLQICRSFRFLSVDVFPWSFSSIHVVTSPSRYIEDNFPGRAFLPGDKSLQEECERLLDRCDRFVQLGLSFVAGPGNRLWSVPQRNSGLKAVLRERKLFEKELSQLASRIKSNGGPYLLGPGLSLVDVAYFPFLHRFELALNEFREYSFHDSDELALVGSYIDRMSQRDPAAETCGDSAAIVQAFARHGCLDYFDYTSASLQYP